MSIIHCFACLMLVNPACDAGAVTSTPSAPAAKKPAEEPKPKRVTTTEAKTIVADLLRTESKGEQKVRSAPLKELTTDAIWNKLGVQVFKEDLPGSVTGQDSFVIKKGKACRIGHSYGSDGVSSLCVADLRHDGRPLLVYTYRCGMSLPTEGVSVCDCLAAGPAEIAWGPSTIRGGGHWAVTSVDDRTVRVTAGKIVLGDLVLQDKDGKASMRIRFRDDVPAEIRRHISGQQ
jgi:hypothetical protein